jgi:hypothetical protein
MFDPRAKDLNCERSLKDERFFNLSMLLSYVHHILTRHLRPNSVVRKYIRYYAAYVMLLSLNGSYQKMFPSTN